MCAGSGGDFVDVGAFRGQSVDPLELELRWLALPDVGAKT